MTFNSPFREFELFSSSDETQLKYTT